MISHIHGRVLSKTNGGLIIDVSGVGYLVRTTDDVASKSAAGEDVRLWTHLAVRENAMDLFGFSTQEEVSFFNLLIGVSGIGPKSALAILGLAPVATLAAAVASGDTSYLTNVSGIGKKSAGKIVIELKDKLKSSGEDLTHARKADTDTLGALQSLGYGVHEAREALKNVDDSVEDTGERVRAALKYLSPHHD